MKRKRREPNEQTERKRPRTEIVITYTMTHPMTQQQHIFDTTNAHKRGKRKSATPLQQKIIAFLLQTSKQQPCS
jgi:hypothetical protein